jgi:murein DD-endopeptidase MepM/ murein hydrolase activator NlpD
MTLFSEDLQTFQRGLEVAGTSPAMPGAVRPSGQDTGRSVANMTSFAEDLENFRSKSVTVDDFGAITKRVAGEAEVAVQKAQQEINAREASRQRQERLRQLNVQDSRTQVATGDPTTGAQMSVEMYGQQGAILPAGVQVTQKFGNINPGVEVFSGGINYGADFAAKRGTPVAIPEGEWEVVDSWGGAKRDGFIGNGDNSGYGNSVLIKNTKTGELMRYSHLDKGSVRAQAGQRLKGGTVFAKTGNTGNSTGPHLDLEYVDANGRYQDVLRSPYAQSLFGAQGGGNPLQAFGEFVGGMFKKEDQRAREIDEVRQREGGMAAVGAASINTDPLVSRLNRFLSERNLPGQTLTKALSDRALQDETRQAAIKVRRGQQIEDQDRKRLNEQAFSRVAGVAKPIVGASTKAEQAMAKSLASIRKSLNSGIARKEIEAIGQLDQLGTKELGKAAMKHIRKKTFIGTDRINTIISELEGLTPSIQPKVRIQDL